MAQTVLAAVSAVLPLRAGRRWPGERKTDVVVPPHAPRVTSGGLVATLKCAGNKGRCGQLARYNGQIHERRNFLLLRSPKEGFSGTTLVPERVMELDFWD